MNVVEYLAAHEAEGMNMHRLAMEAGIAYSTIHPHVRRGKPLGIHSAQRLETYSSGEMTAAEILGLARAPSLAAAAPKKKARKKAA